MKLIADCVGEIGQVYATKFGKTPVQEQEGVLGWYQETGSQRTLCRYRLVSHDCFLWVTETSETKTVADRKEESRSGHSGVDTWLSEGKSNG